jgi:hypothetical protein
MKIQRHKIDVEAIREDFDRESKRLPEFLPYAKTNPSALSIIASIALNLVRFGSAAAPGSALLRYGLTVAAQSLTSIFAVDRATGENVEILLGDERMILPCKIDKSIVEASKWISAFWLGIICRDSQQLNSLCETSIERLRQSPTTNPEYRYLLVEALQAFWRGSPDIGKRLVATMAATDPEREDIRAPDWVLKLDLPLIQSLFHVLARDEEFGETFVQALKLHKEYWTASQKRKKDWDGFVSFGLTAIATLAREREVPFEVESNYLLKECQGARAE